MRGFHSPLPYFISWLLSIFLLLPSCVNQHEDKKPVTVNASSFPLAGMTIDELQEKLNHGEYTSMQITQMYLDRIQQLDISGPALHAVIEINPEALEIASGLDEEETGDISGDHCMVSL